MKKTNSNNIINPNQQTKNEIDDKNNNRSLLIGLSNCGKTYLTNQLLHQKQDSVFIFTKTLNQYPKIKAQSSDEIEPLENDENSTVVFDDMLLSKQESNIVLFFTRGRPNNTDINYISHSFFHFPKNTIRSNSNIIELYKKTLRDIILLFPDAAGLDMDLEEWKQLCHKAWENDIEYLQRDRLAKVGEVGYTIRSCNENTIFECTTEAKLF